MGLKIRCYDPTNFSRNESWPIDKLAICAMTQHTKLPVKCVVAQQRKYQKCVMPQYEKRA